MFGTRLVLLAFLAASMAGCAADAPNEGSLPLVQVHASVLACPVWLPTLFPPLGVHLQPEGDPTAQWSVRVVGREGPVLASGPLAASDVPGNGSVDLQGMPRGDAFILQGDASWYIRLREVDGGYLFDVLGPGGGSWAITGQDRTQPDGSPCWHAGEVTLDPSSGSRPQPTTPSRPPRAIQS